MPSYRLNVVGLAALFQVLRLLVIAVLLFMVLFSLGCGSSSTTTTTAGPAPTITTSAPPIALEGVLYTYSPAATTTDNSTVTFTLTTGPTGAAVTNNTVTWTPTHLQSRTANNFTITATTSNAGVTTQSFTITPNGNIDGTAIDHAVAGGTIVDYPQDLSAANIAVLLSNNKGGFNTLKGSGDSSGNFTIPNVPPGGFWLHLPRNDSGVISDNYIWTTSSDVDAGQLVIGRPDAVIATTPVTIHTNVSLTVPPTGSDSIDWVSPDARSSGSSGPPSNPLTATFLQTGGLIDSSKSDKGYLLHNTTSGQITREVESETFGSLMETNGGTVNLTGSMTANSGSTTDPVIDVTQFDPINAAIPGVGAPTTKNFILYDTGYAGSEGWLPSNTSSALGYRPIQLIDINLSTVTADTDFGSIPYGLVTSAGVAYTQFEDLASRTINVGGSNYIFQNNGQILISNAVPTSAAPIVPTLGEPTTPTVDGKYFFGAQNISLAPQIAWGPPTLGTATSYEVTIVNPSTLSAATPDIHYFYTSGNSVSVPAGVLQANTSYVVILQALMNQNTAFQTAPFRLGTSAA